MSNTQSFKISQPNRKGINIQFTKTHKDKITIKTITGRTFDSSPSIILKINAFSYYFNFPEMQQKNLMHIFHKNYPFPQNIFITSLFPDSIGGLSLFFLQNLANFRKTYSITGPKEIPNVILFDTDYFGKKISKIQNLNITNDFEDKNIKAISLVLTQSISYDILIKNINQRLLVIDCRSIDDLRLLPNLNEFNVIVHLTIPEILIQKEYTSFFTSFTELKKNIENSESHSSRELFNICFMPSGIFSNHQSEEYYTKRANSFLQSLSFGKTLKPPPGFINFTSSYSKFDFISKVITIKGEGEEIEINFNNNEGNNSGNISTDLGSFNENTTNNLNSLQILSRLIEFEPNLPDFQEYAFTFLGSGTKHVSPTMNLSGYLIHTKYGFIVFDPSEGFFNQLKRKFGPRKTEYILKNIECVWISHYHQDHILGSPSLLYERSKLTSKQIYFFAPQKLINDIKKISQLYGDFHLIYNNREPEEYEESAVLNNPLLSDKGNESNHSYYDRFKADKSKNIKDQYSSVPALFKINDHLSIQSIDVSHIEYSKGCLLLIDGKASIAFSGDHGYKKDYFSDVFKNCDLLIHEATFPVYVRERIGDITNHCYMDEAIDTTISMNSRIACLTHFSQRYNQSELEYRASDKIMLAFDFLEFTSENAIDVFKNCSKMNT